MTDPWEAARERQREDVGKIFAPRRWDCPHCGAENETASHICTTCGKSRVERVNRFERVRPFLVPILGLAVVLAIAGFIVIPGLQDDAASERRAEAARQAKLERDEAERIRREQAPKRFDASPRRRGEAFADYRARLRSRAAALVTADAQARIEAGTLKGPVTGTECFILPLTDTRRAAETDTAVARVRYECIAYSRRVPLSELEGQERTGVLGQPFYAVADAGTGRIDWCRVIPRAGEGGKSLASVPIPEVCRDPEGPG